MGRVGVCMVCTGDIGEREHGVGTGVKNKTYKKKNIRVGFHLFTTGSFIGWVRYSVLWVTKLRFIR